MGSLGVSTLVFFLCGLLVLLEGLSVNFLFSATMALILASGVAGAVVQVSCAESLLKGPLRRMAKRQKESPVGWEICGGACFQVSTRPGMIGSLLLPEIIPNAVYGLGVGCYIPRDAYLGKPHEARHRIRPSIVEVDFVAVVVLNRILGFIRNICTATEWDRRQQAASRPSRDFSLCNVGDRIFTSLSQERSGVPSVQDMAISFK